MKKLITTLLLLLVLFACALLFSKTNIMGWSVNPYAAFGMAIGLMISGYIIAALILFILRKLETKDQQRLLIAVFLVLFALLWKSNFTDDAKYQCRLVLEEVVSEIQNNNYQNL